MKRPSPFFPHLVTGLLIISLVIGLLSVPSMEPLLITLFILLEISLITRLFLGLPPADPPRGAFISTLLSALVGLVAISLTLWTVPSTRLYFLIPLIAFSFFAYLLVAFVAPRHRLIMTQWASTTALLLLFLSIGFNETALVAVWFVGTICNLASLAWVSKLVKNGQKSAASMAFITVTAATFLFVLAPHLESIERLFVEAEQEVTVCFKGQFE